MNSIDLNNVIVNLNGTFAVVSVHYPPPGKLFSTQKERNQWLSNVPFNQGKQQGKQQGACFCPPFLFNTNITCYQNPIDIVPWSISLGLWILIFCLLICFMYGLCCILPQALNWHGG